MQLMSIAGKLPSFFMSAVATIALRKCEDNIDQNIRRLEAINKHFQSSFRIFC